MLGPYLTGITASTSPYLEHEVTVPSRTGISLSGTQLNGVLNRQRSFCSLAGPVQPGDWSGHPANGAPGENLEFIRANWNTLRPDSGGIILNYQRGQFLFRALPLTSAKFRLIPRAGNPLRSISLRARNVTMNRKIRLRQSLRTFQDLQPLRNHTRSGAEGVLRSGCSGTSGPISIVAFSPVCWPACFEGLRSADAAGWQPVPHLARSSLQAGCLQFGWWARTAAAASLQHDLQTGRRGSINRQLLHGPEVGAAGVLLVTTLNRMARGGLSCGCGHAGCGGGWTGLQRHPAGADAAHHFLGLCPGRPPATLGPGEWTPPVPGAAFGRIGYLHRGRRTPP